MGSQIRRKNARRIPQKEECARRDAWELAKDVYKLKKEFKRYILLSCRSLGGAGTLFDKAGRETFHGRLWSFHAHVK